MSLFSLIALFSLCSGCSPVLGDPGAAAKRAEPAEVTLAVIPPVADRGSPARAIVRGLGPDAEIAGVFDGKPVFFFPTKNGHAGLFGADIMIELGEHLLKVAYEADGQTGSFEVPVRVADRDYGTRDIKVPVSQVRLSQADQERAAREKVLTDRALATVSPEKLWKGEFLEPVDASINSSFGRKTRMNGVLSPRPHAGADYLAKEGTPVRAPADGVVILAGDHFFSGKAIYMDHGQGLISMYFHLSEILVKEGDVIRKGQSPIGLVGKTGRVTGAHLHYGVYLNGARIDPSAFRKMTASLED